MTVRAFEITLHGPGKTLTIAAEDQGQVHQLLEQVRFVMEHGFGVPLGNVRSRVMDDSELRESDHRMLAEAEARAVGRPASPYKLKSATETLALATGGPVGAERVLAALVGGFGGSLPTNVAQAIIDGRAAIPPLPAKALDPAEQVRRAAAA